MKCDLTLEVIVRGEFPRHRTPVVSIVLIMTRFSVSSMKILKCSLLFNGFWIYTQLSVDALKVIVNNKHTQIKPEQKGLGNATYYAKAVENTRRAKHIVIGTRLDCVSFKLYIKHMVWVSSIPRAVNSPIIDEFIENTLMEMGKLQYLKQRHCYITRRHVDFIVL